MGWMATLVVLSALILGACFLLIEQKALWTEFKIALNERAQHPDVYRRGKPVRVLVIVLAIYGTVGAAFFVGWQQAGTTAGVLGAVGLALVWVLGAAAVAVRSAWISRK